jgi:putative ABC transport system substrate-binding protein
MKCHVMRRREFITLLGGATMTWPLAARAQQSKVPVIGLLHASTPDVSTSNLTAFRKGLSESGFVEGRNVTIAYRFAHDNLDRLAELAADLVHQQVSVIVTGGGPPPALAAKAATSTIPVVFAFGGDPVGLHLVASLNRPGGNVTGATVITSELGAKRLGLLSELVPQGGTIGYLHSTTLTRSQQELADDMVAAARVLRRNLVVAEARSVNDFEPALADMITRGAKALLVGSQPLFIGRRDTLIPLITRHKIPAMYQSREFTQDGGLVSYGGDYNYAFYLGGIYAGSILKGAKPADLPVQQSTKFELVINAKAANALGLTIPPSLLALADEVIE